MHIIDVFCTLNAVFRESVLILKKTGFQIVFCMGCHSNTGNWFHFNCMKGLIPLKPIVKQDKRWRIEFLLLLKLADSSINDGRSGF